MKYSLASMAFAFAAAALPAVAQASGPSEFAQPWLSKNHALVIDAYEYNPLDWQQLAGNKRIAAFINKGSDGLPPAYRCSGDETAIRLCKALWKRYSVARELFHTRKTIAKSLGLKWGAYHVARPGNPIDQANHFLDFAEPGDDDLMALDLEGLDTERWMSLEDAETFVRHIKFRTGRYPVLYANDVTAEYIADNRDRFRILSRLPLWYARYKPDIGAHFPKGYWQSYSIWQFSAAANCNRRRCPYRVAGAKDDIDVNVAPVDAPTLRRQWPFGNLINPVAPVMAKVPLPATRKAGLSGEARLVLASVTLRPQHQRAYAYPLGNHAGTAEYLAFLKDVSQAYRNAGEMRATAEIDGAVTGAIAPGKKDRLRPNRELPRTEPSQQE